MPMSVIEMNKLSLVGLGGDREDILKELMAIRAVHVIDVAPEMQESRQEIKTHPEEAAREISRLEEAMEKISLVLKHLEKYDHRKKGLFAAHRAVSEQSYEEVLEEQERLWNVVDAVMQCDRHMAHLHTEKNKYGNLTASLEIWEKSDIPLNMTSTKTSVIQMGYISQRNSVEKLEKQLEEQAGACHLQVLNRDQDHSYLYLIYHRGVAEAVGGVLKSHGFTRVTFEGLKGTAEENIRHASRKIEEIDREYVRTAENMAVYAEDIGRLEILYDSLGMQRDRKKALIHMTGTENTFMLEGWIPAHLSECIAERLQKKWDCAAYIQAPDEEEEYPVLLKNCDVGRSVEAITAMYSSPHPKETDPNFVMSLFFILFYGFMMGDGVYGLIMIAVAALILWKAKPAEGMYWFMKLMLYCGISSVFWGALFGGWFGIPALSKYPLWINPVEKPEEFLRWVLLLGVLHIYVGIGIRGYNLLREKKYVDILLDVGASYMFFTGFVLFTLPYVFNTGPESFQEWVTVGKYMLGFGAIVIVLTQGRGQKNLFLKLPMGLVRLYDLIKFMSDVLSYSRLMALGLATSVIGLIVFDIATMNGMDNIIKVIGFVLILAVGHALNFAIALLSAYVHSSRLQYIEFFSRFYRGGGIPFKPLRTDTKFIYLTGGEICEYSIRNDR